MADSIMSDPWLQRWLPLIRARGGRQPILELGCGEGDDTLTLTQAGHHVIAIDLDAPAIAAAKIKAPTADYYCQDLRATFPPQAIELSIVVASLSLHYFTWNDTLAIVERLRTTLHSNGVLLCRLNSTNDLHYGAVGHPSIAANYYLVNGEPKRFFDRQTVIQLFHNGWKILALDEKIIAKYQQPKSVWEVILDRNA